MRRPPRAAGSEKRLELLGAELERRAAPAAGWRRPDIRSWLELL